MAGIFELYNTTAMNHINGWAKKPRNISRSKIDLTILRELDKAAFPIEWRMAWYNAILTSDRFDVMWIGAQQKYSLPDVAIARYVPDETLCTYSLKDCASLDEDVESMDDHSGSDASNYLGSTPVPAAGTSLGSSETLHDDWSDDRTEEVWYGEEGQAEKEKLAALGGKQRIVTVADEKQITGGGGNNVKKVRARKAATKVKAKEGIKKERIRKATNAKMKKK
ncbi:hypothetical protein MMC29_002401 [Sticta canariensis]|nr:hypothetical protein [Sticta canariensis]